VVLAFALILNVGEVHRLAVSGLPGLVAHSNWRFGNALYGVAVFAAFLSHREQLARWVSERVAGLVQRFNREYSFAFYLAHILLLTLAGNLQVHVLRLPPAASLVFLAVTTVAGTMGLLVVLKQVPIVRGFLGVRSASRSQDGDGHPHPVPLPGGEGRGAGVEPV
jgi:peptidoglycan/LPS O-acetylase OafA/YrhL